MKIPRVSLEQWAVLQAVVDLGGYAQAAETLHRSQSAISYTIARMQEQLGVDLLRLEGRKAQLTEVGAALLQRSRHLLAEAGQLETLAHNLAGGWEPQVRLYVEAALPTELLLEVLAAFQADCRGTDVQLHEFILAGAEAALRAGAADLVITPLVPAGFLGDRLLEVEFIAVAHRDHPLHTLGRPLNLSDLIKERQVIIRDSSGDPELAVGWQQTEQRWTVSSLDTAVAAVVKGLGFSWLPRHRIAGYLQQGVLRALPLAEGQQYFAQFSLLFGQGEARGPATRQLAQLFRQHAQRYTHDHSN